MSSARATGKAPQNSMNPFMGNLNNVLFPKNLAGRGPSVPPGTTSHKKLECELAQRYVPDKSGLFTLLTGK